MATCPNKNTQEWRDLVKSVGENRAYFLWDYEEGNKDYLISYQLPNTEGQIVTEKTVRDLAARISDRIGIPHRFIADKTQEFKGKLENGVAYINLAHATLDTPIHEILGHPIIRAIKNKQLVTKRQQWNFNKPFFNDQTTKNNTGKTITHEGHIYEVYELKKFSNTTYKAINFKRNEEIELSEKEFNDIVNQSQLYQNLLKELEYGKGKEVLDRIKRDYNKKFERGKSFTFEGKDYIADTASKTGYRDKYGDDVHSNELETALFAYELKHKDKVYYTLEEQQEEAIVELLGLMTAEKLDNVKDGKLISLLKRLLKEMKQFIRSLINQKEVEIDKLPDNMTVNDLANLLAYSNNKLILPGYEVKYTTPDNQTFKTYQEASNHISQLAKSVEDVDLSDISINKKLSKEDLEKISELELQKKELENYFNSKKYQQDKDFELYKLNQQLNELRNKKVEFYSQEPYLNLEDKKKYGFDDFDYIRVESTYGRGNEYHKDILGENYEGYYIHGYNTATGKPKKKILPITKRQAEEIWSKDESSKYEVGDRQEIFRIEDKIRYLQTDEKIKYDIQSLEREIQNIKLGQNTIQSFIEKNKEYEQSKEIIEEWKKVNNIVYNPEEIYSRGQGFYSVMGAYSDFDVNLLLQNLLHHIEDNQKAGGEFTISAYTAPVDKKINHLEVGGKLKFVIYPKSEDIKWAAPTDVYSGSVWDASQKVSKTKASELLGVSYTKYPSLQNVYQVVPNLASIVDNLSHHHNELGITLTGSNFRIDYTEDTPFTTKKIVDSVNSILDSKYGKLNRPNTTTTFKWNVYQETEDLGDAMSKDPTRGFVASFNTQEEAQQFANSQSMREMYYVQRGSAIGLSPKNEPLKESMSSIIARTVSPKLGNWRIIKGPGGGNMEWAVEYMLGDSGDIDFFNTEQEAVDFVDSLKNRKGKEKEYTGQALVNTKIAALKEVAKKYPRSLIRSEVRRINTSSSQELYDQFEEDELPFQKISSTKLELPSDKDLNKSLDKFIEAAGIDVTIVPFLKNRLGKVDPKLSGEARTVKTANGIKKAIDIVAGKDTFNNRAEEVAHIFTAMLGFEHPLYKAMEKRVSSFAEYQEVKRDYPELKTEQEIRFEAIGKVIKNNLKDLVEKKAKDTTLQAWWDALLRFLGKFVDGIFKDPFKKAALDILEANINQYQIEIVQANSKLSELDDVYLSKTGKYSYQNPKKLVNKATKSGKQTSTLNPFQVKAINQKELDKVSIQSDISLNSSTIDEIKEALRDNMSEFAYVDAGGLSFLAEQIKTGRWKLSCSL